MNDDTGQRFDRYAKEYDRALSEGLSLSGEAADYFALGRIDWLKEKLSRLDFRASRIIDYGCGNGGSIRPLQKAFLPTEIVGLDTSNESLSIARNGYGTDHIAFFNPSEYIQTSLVDLVFSNGTFHHIDPAQRVSNIERIYRMIRPGGYFALWENNPWSIGARLVMSKIAFDKDAVMLYPGTAMAMLKTVGFAIVDKSYRFIFPNSLKTLRFLEAPLSSLPLGAQYLILSRKSS